MDDGLVCYRHMRARLTLPRADDLPMLHSVRHLSFGLWERAPDPGVQLAMAAQMPSVVSLDLSVDGTEMRYPGVQRRDRKILADVLTKYSEQTKQVSRATMDMSMQDGATYEWKRAMPNYAYPRAYDVLGASLRTWSQRLTSFEVSGVFNEALFWPQAEEEDASEGMPEWRNLKTFDVELELCTPSGGWYFLPQGEMGRSFGKPPRDPASDPEDMPPVFADYDYDPAAGDAGADSSTSEPRVVIPSLASTTTLGRIAGPPNSATCTTRTRWSRSWRRGPAHWNACRRSGPRACTLGSTPPTTTSGSVARRTGRSCTRRPGTTTIAWATPRTGTGRWTRRSEPPCVYFLLARAAGGRGGTRWNSCRR